jgi:poly(A) polymerase
MDIVASIMEIARCIGASSSEKEVERLLGSILRGTPFANKTHAVGGAVRDEVLGLDAKDLDIVVEMKDGAEKLTAMLHRMFPVETSTPRRLGVGYPIWQITFKDNVTHQGEEYKTDGAVIEFVDTQKEAFPDPESRQRVVEYGTLKEDIERRDFTVNMLLKDLTTGEIVDLTGTSMQDLRDGVLRGHPEVDFDKILRDDPLRMIRMIRFQAKYGWKVPLSVMKAVRRNAARIQIISGERIRDELVKVMNIGKLAQAIRMMKAVGLLQYVLPEIQAMEGVEHEYTKGHHLEGDVLRHTLLVLQNAKPGVESQLAALLHDVGKPESQEVIDGLIRFLGHEKVGGEMAEGIMRRLKFDGNVIRRVRSIVENHMRPHHLTREDAGPKGLRKFIREVGAEMVGAILDMAESDQLGSIPSANTIPDLRREIDALMAPVEKADELPVDGKDVIRILGIKPGPKVGEALVFLKDKKFDMLHKGREMTKDDAERILVEWFKEAGQ